MGQKYGEIEKVDDHKATLIQAWEAVPAEKLRVLLESRPETMRTVKELGGHKTMY